MQNDAHQHSGIAPQSVIVLRQLIVQGAPTCSQQQPCSLQSAPQFLPQWEYHSGSFGQLIAFGSGKAVCQPKQSVAVPQYGFQLLPQKRRQHFLMHGNYPNAAEQIG